MISIEKFEQKGANFEVLQLVAFCVYIYLPRVGIEPVGIY